MMGIRMTNSEVAFWLFIGSGEWGGMTPSNLGGFVWNLLSEA